MTGPNTSRTQDPLEQIGLSKPAMQRLKWMEFFGKHKNARLTCRYFGISPDTFYLWKRRYDSSNPKTLEDNLKTRRPKRPRVSRHKEMYFDIVSKLKALHPHMGKYRIAKILKNTGFEISVSTVDRLLRSEKR